MTYRRLGVAWAATLLGLLAAAALSAPAFARHGDLQVTSSCHRSDDRPPAAHTARAPHPGHPDTAVTVRPARCRRQPVTSTTQPSLPDQVPRTSIQTVMVTRVLPFTGASSGPLLLAAVSLLGAGTAILVASRSRRRGRVVR